MVFDQAQPHLYVHSAEARTQWNCKKTILLISDRGYNQHINKQKSYSIRILFDGASESDLKNKFKLYFFNGHPENVDCYANDYYDGYCGGATPAPTTTRATTRYTTPQSTQTAPQTNPTTRSTTTTTRQTTPPTTTPSTTRRPSINHKCPKHLSKLVREGNLAVGQVSGRTINLDTCERASDPLNKPPSPIENWLTKELWDDFFYKSNLGFGPHPCLPYSYEAFVIAARYFPDFADEYYPNTPDGKPMPQGYTKEEINKRDLAGFLAHMVQETGENDGWILSHYNTTHKLTWDEAEECYMKGALWTWFEGGGDGTGHLGLSPDTGHFECGDHPSCGEWSGKSVSNAGTYCETATEMDGYGMKCSQEKNSRGKVVTYAGRGPKQLSWNYNYKMFSRFLLAIGITDDNGNELDLVGNPNLVITKMDPPLGFLSAMWFYMTGANGQPSMHDAVIGNWVGYGKWSGAVFGPTSKLINNECTGESTIEGDIGGFESRRIKAFKFFCKYFGTKATADFEDDSVLSCVGFSYADVNKGAKKSWGFDWSQPIDWSQPEPEYKCICAPKDHSGKFRYQDPKFANSQSPMIAFNNQWNKEWCEELLRTTKKHGDQTYKCV